MQFYISVIFQGLPDNIQEENLHFSISKKTGYGRTDGQTDGRTDRRTDRRKDGPTDGRSGPLSHIDARTHLKDDGEKLIK